VLKSLPKKLDDIYARIQLNIDEEYAQDAFKVLQWLMFSIRAVRIEELAEVVAIDLERNLRFDPERRLRNPEDLLVIFSSLVTLSSWASRYWYELSDEMDEENDLKGCSEYELEYKRDFGTEYESD